jgi:hypothetical protein
MIRSLTAWRVGALVAVLALPALCPAQSKLSLKDNDEWRDMLLAIMAGDMGPGAGWFRPSETRYDWAWLQRFDANKDRAVTPDEIKLPAVAFDRLDRDGDGRLGAVDFDWSESSPLHSKTMMARMWLMRADQDRDGKLSAGEWAKLFERAARDQEHLDLEEVRKLLFPPTPPRPAADMPSTVTLLQGLYSGEIGSPFPGPRLGDFAPNFTLSTHDGSQSITLKSFRGQKPVALVFGSFT